jgi:hypothetical protein
MIKRISLSHDQAIKAVENGGFSDDITASDDAVVLVLTECPKPCRFFHPLSPTPELKPSGASRAPPACSSAGSSTPV